MKLSSPSTLWWKLEGRKKRRKERKGEGKIKERKDGKQERKEVEGKLEGKEREGQRARKRNFLCDTIRFLFKAAGIKEKVWSGIQCEQATPHLPPAGYTSLWSLRASLPSQSPVTLLESPACQGSRSNQGNLFPIFILLSANSR